MPDFIQVNVNITEEDAKLLDIMMTEDAYDNRSAFVRRLIRQEWQRRNPRAPVTNGNGNGEQNDRY